MKCSVVHAEIQCALPFLFKLMVSGRVAKEMMVCRAGGDVIQKLRDAVFWELQDQPVAFNATSVLNHWQITKVSFETAIPKLNLSLIVSVFLWTPLAEYKKE